MKEVEYKGLKFKLPGADKHFSENLYKFVGEVEQLAKDVALQSRHVFVDVGACFGVSAISALKYWPHIQRVVAVEADHRNFELLERNVALNGFADRVECIWQAVTDFEGTVQLLQSSSGNIGVSFVAWKREDDALRQYTLTPVPCNTLASILDAHAVPLRDVGLIWMDAQGCEHRIIRASRNLLGETDCPWYVELAPTLLRQAGSTLSSFYSAVSPYFKTYVDRKDTAKAVQPISKLPDLWRYHEQNPKADGNPSHTNILLKRC